MRVHRRRGATVNVDMCCGTFHAPTLLTLACARGSDDMARLLVQWGARTSRDLRVQTPITPLACACDNDRVVLAKLLACDDVTNRAGTTPLIIIDNTLSCFLATETFANLMVSTIRTLPQ